MSNTEVRTSHPPSHFVFYHIRWLKKGESRIRTDVATREDEDPCKGLGFARFPLSRRR